MVHHGAPWCSGGSAAPPGHVGQAWARRFSSVSSHWYRCSPVDHLQARRLELALSARLLAGAPWPKSRPDASGSSGFALRSPMGEQQLALAFCAWALLLLAPPLLGGLPCGTRESSGDQWTGRLILQLHFRLPPPPCRRCSQRPACTCRAAVHCSYVFLWIALSAGVIMYNKWVLAYYGARGRRLWLPPLGTAAPPDRPHPCPPANPRSHCPAPPPHLLPTTQASPTPWR